MPYSARIREATLEDAAAIAELLGQMGYPSTVEEVRIRLGTILPHPDYSGWVAEMDGRVVGFTGAAMGHFFEKNGSYGRLLALVVDPGSRRKGAGAELVRAAEDWMVSRGGTAVVVNSGDHRMDAHAFYERQGYRASGRRFVKTLHWTD